MRYVDCFNGDADGICALTQLRLAQPVESELVTGVKRDINLLDRVNAKAGDRITVLDISLDKNRAGLASALANDAHVFYCDHHFAGDIPEHDNLTAIINTTSDVCTSLLINQYLNGEFLEWAVVGTFGDNLRRSAVRLAKPLSLSDQQLNQLENLGIYLNYNGYGASLDDLYFHPEELYKRTVQHVNALGFIHDDADTFAVLENGYHEDMQKAASSDTVHQTPKSAVFTLPNESWARRVSGVFGNDLANQAPSRAHAVMTERAEGGYVVSVRAPLDDKRGADEICREFDTGGGRAAAAGINNLSAEQVEKFITVFSEFYRD